MKKVVVLSGSIRKGRTSHAVAKTIASKLRENRSINTILLDLRDYPLPILVERIDEMDELPKGFQEFSDELSTSDGVIIVSPEYKNGIPGSLKNALDYLEAQIFKHLPLGIVTVSSGGFGGSFCLSQLRLVGLALGGVPIPEKLCISKVNDVFDKQGNLLDDSFDKKASDFTDSFLWYVEKLSEAT